MKRIISVASLATFVACSSGSTSTVVGNNGGANPDTTPDGGTSEPSGTPLPDGTTEPSTDVPFPRNLSTAFYQAFAVGADGAVTMAASTTLEVVVAGYGPDFTRRFAIATPENMDHAVVRGLVPRARGGVVLEYGERDTPTREGFIAILRADGTAAHAVVAVAQEAYGLAIDASDRVVFGTIDGIDSARKAVVKRLTADGNVDASFGSAGTASFICGGPTSAPTRLAAGLDGSVFSLVETSSGQYLAKLTPSGELDAAFGVAGCAPLAGGFSPYQIEADPSGPIWLTGSVKGADAYDHGAVLKLLPQGVLDAKFGTGGLVELMPPSVSTNLAVAAQPTDSGLLVLNSRYLGDEKYVRDVVRLDATGERSDIPALHDSGLLDFKVTNGGLNLTYLKTNLAGRVAAP